MTVPSLSVGTALLPVHFSGLVLRFSSVIRAKCRLPPLRKQPISELGSDIDPRAVGSRLALLLCHFPKLRLVWSRR
jgi:hypothetical protein